MFHIARAIQMIEELVGPITQSSAVYETEAWGKTDQENFLNLVLEVEYYGSASDLLDTTQGIETDLGRVKASLWGPRIIDIDILLMDNHVMQTERLTIPHMHMANRNFVLFPLAEVAPDIIHPVFQKSIQQLLDECKDEAYVTVVNPNMA